MPKLRRLAGRVAHDREQIPNRIVRVRRIIPLPVDHLRARSNSTSSVNVVVRTEIGPQHGPEKDQAADMSLPEQFSKLLLVNRYVRHQSTLTPLDPHLSTTGVTNAGIDAGMGGSFVRFISGQAV